LRLIHRLCEGLFGRYFAYRTKYVAYFRENAPERVGWAVASEIARLVFTLACTILIALILWALVLGAWQSGGHLLALAAFAVLALYATACAVVATAGLVTAISELRSFG